MPLPASSHRIWHGLAGLRTRLFRKAAVGGTAPPTRQARSPARSQGLAEASKASSRRYRALLVRLTQLAAASPCSGRGASVVGALGWGGGETDPNDLVNVSSSSALGRLRPGMFPGRFWRDTGTRFEEGDALAGFAQIYHGGREASGGPCADKSISRSVLNVREVRSYKEKAPPPPPPPTDEALKNVKHLPTL